MNHFNFFENAQSGKKEINVTAVSAILILCAACVLAGTYIVSKTRKTQAEERLDYLNSVENDPAFVGQYEIEKRIEAQLALAQEDYVFLGSTDWLIRSGSTATKESIERLTSFFPANTKIVKLTISQYSVTIEGVAENLDAMIRAEKNLNESGLYAYVFIDSAKEDGHPEENGKDAVTFKCRVSTAEKER